MDRDDDARSLHLTRLARTLTQRHGIEVRFARQAPVARHDLLVLPDTLLAGDGDVDDDAITGLVDLHAARIRFGAIDDIAARRRPRCGPLRRRSTTGARPAASLRSIPAR